MYGISKVQRLVRGLKPTLFTIRSLSIVSPQKTDKTWPLPLHVERSVRPRKWKRGLGPFWRNTSPSLVTDNDFYFFSAFLDRATKRTTKRTTKTTIIIHEIADMESPPYPILVWSALWHISYLPLTMFILNRIRRETLVFCPYKTPVFRLWFLSTQAYPPWPYVARS